MTTNISQKTHVILRLYVLHFPDAYRPKNNYVSFLSDVYRPKNLYLWLILLCEMDLVDQIIIKA